MLLSRHTGDGCVTRARHWVPSVPWKWVFVQEREETTGWYLLQDTAKGGSACAGASDHAEAQHPPTTPRRAAPISIESASSSSALTLTLASSYRGHISCPQQQTHKSLCTANRPGPNDFNLPRPRVLHPLPSPGDPSFSLWQTQGSNLKAARKTQKLL